MPYTERGWASPVSGVSRLSSERHCGLRWTPFGTAVDAFALIDSDICQAIQSLKEEIDSGRGGDLEIAQAKADRCAALKESSDAVSHWEGDHLCSIVHTIHALICTISRLKLNSRIPWQRGWLPLSYVMQWMGRKYGRPWPTCS